MVPTGAVLVTQSPSPNADIETIVVDDDSFALRFMEKALGRFGVSRVTSCLTAPDALGAVDAAKGPRLLLICDLNMPDMDGIEFLRVLATRKFKGSVLIHSGADGAVRDAAAKLAAAYGFDLLGTFAKPIALDRLEALLGRVRAVS
jgi:CheY-like chemotaxis protein